MRNPWQRQGCFRVEYRPPCTRGLQGAFGVVISKHGFNDSHAPQVPLWKRRSDLKSSPHLPRDRYWGNNVAVHRRALLSAVIEDTLPWQASRLVAQMNGAGSRTPAGDDPVLPVGKIKAKRWLAFVCLPNTAAARQCQL